MATYYLHVEALNLGHFVFDTHDISTIRGGSFMLLQVIGELAQQVPNLNLHPVSTAASQGLFRFDAPDADAVSRVTGAVLTHLNGMSDGHATFLTAVERADDTSFPLILERLAAQIRRQQLRTPTVRVPEPASTAQECFLDGWRPGVEPYPLRTGGKVSRSTAFRRTYGINIKHRLFYRLLGDEHYADHRSTQDLTELSRNRNMGILDGKIAFLHVDGNSFGRIRKRLCTDPDKRTHFDHQIQETCRKPFLQTLLDQARADPEFNTRDSIGRRALRLEVILWGGDEMTLIVPAWRGWQVLQHFYQYANQLQVDGIELSHRAVMILCHNDAPILQIRQLAEGLLERTKKDIGHRFDAAIQGGQTDLNKDDRSNHALGNAFHYLSLESFDMLGGSLDSFLDRYYKEMAYKQLMMQAQDMPMLLEHLAHIRRHAPRGKVLSMIQILQTPRPKTDDGEEIKQWEEAQANRITAQLKQITDPLSPQARTVVQDALNTLSPFGDARWYWLADLWDYLLVWSK